MSSNKSLADIFDEMYSAPSAMPEAEFDEEQFRSWYGGMAEKHGLAPDPDDPKHFYDYRKAFTAGAAPDETGHWPSEFKKKGHPRQIVKGIDTTTGERVFPETEYDDIISAAAENHGIPYQVMYRLLWTESRFNPKAVSPKGAQGIAQFMPGTAQEMGLKDPFNPAEAIHASARYLKQNYDKFGDWKLAAAAYNAGPGNVEKHGGIPPFPETQKYVSDIFPEGEDIPEGAESQDLDQVLDQMFDESEQASALADAQKKAGEENYAPTTALAPHRNLINTIFQSGFGRNAGDKIDEFGRPVDANGKAYVNDQLMINKIAAETLGGLSSLVGKPMETIRGGLDFFMSLPAFGIGLIAAASNGTAELIKQIAYTKPSDISDTMSIMHGSSEYELPESTSKDTARVPVNMEQVYNTMSKYMGQSFEFFDPGKQLLIGKPTEESALVGEVAMAPLNAISAAGQAVADYEGFKDMPNVRGTIRISSDILSLIAMGFIFKGRSRRQEFVKEAEDITTKAAEIKAKADEIASSPDAVLRSIQEKVLAVEKERLEYKAKMFAEQFGNDLMLVEEIGRQLERQALENARPVVESRPEMAEGMWTAEGKPERRSTKYVPASEEATKKNFPPSKEVDTVINRYRMEEQLWVDKNGNHRIETHREAAKIAKENGGTVLPTTEGKWAVALEPQRRVKYELDAVRGEPAKEGVPKKEATPSKEELRVEGKKKVEPKVETKKKKNELPPLKTTQDAVAFGEKATPGQLAEAERRMGEIKDQVNELMKSEDFEANAQKIADLGYEAQLYREALEASEGKHPSQVDKTLKKINDLDKQHQKKPTVVIKKKAAPKVEEKPKAKVEEAPKIEEADEVIPEEHLKMLDRLIEDIDADIKKSKPKETEQVTDVDRATGSGPGVEKSNGIFFQEKKKADELGQVFSERAKQVASDPEIYLQKLINDVNRWYHGAKDVDIKAAREALSTLAGKAPEMREFFMAGVDHIQFADLASEAAKWARSVGRPKVGGGVQLNMMVPLNQIPPVIKKALDALRGYATEKGKSVNLERLHRHEGIYKKTGFWLAKDGMWRKELDFDQMKYHTTKEARYKYTDRGYADVYLKDVLSYPDLYKEVPGLDGVLVVYDKNLDVSGRYDPALRIIYLKHMHDKTVLAHEVSHAVNHLTGSKFMGSSVEYAGSLEKYWRDPGEMEARLVSTRMHMSKAERMSEPPWVTLDRLLQREGETMHEKIKVPFRGTELYSGVPIDQIAKLVKKGWKELRAEQELFGDQIKGWLMGFRKDIPEPDNIYRGVYKGTNVRSTEEFQHGTPWAYEAARGGKGGFGDPSGHDVYSIPASKDTKYYRGGSLAGDPLERTRIDSSKGMTWSEVMEKAKELYYQDLAKLRAQERKFGRELTKSDEMVVADRVLGDIRRATFETDMEGGKGIWSEFGPDRDLARDYPKLRSIDVVEGVARRKKEMGFTDDQIPEVKILDRAGVKLYSGVPIDKAAAELIKGAKRVKAYMDEARGAKEFKPKEAAQLVREELNRSFIDRSGNLRVALLDKLGELGYKVVQKMYLAKGASSKAAQMLKQMVGEVYDGLSNNEQKILDNLILSDRMIDIGKTRGEKEFNYPKNTTLKDYVTYSEFFQDMEKIPADRAALIRQRAEAYFEWMKKPLAEMRDAGLISQAEFDALSKHQYRRIKLVDIFDKRYGSTIGGRKRTVYDSGVEALSRGKGTDIYEPSSQVMALEVFNRAYGRIYNNAANQALHRVAIERPDNPFVRVKAKKGDKIPSGWHRVFFYEGGKRKQMFVNPEYSREWITRSPEISYKLAQIIRHASGSSVLRTFATGIDWGFALANLPRDVMHAWFAAREFRDGKWHSTYSTFAPAFGTQMTIDMGTIFRDAIGRKGRYLDYINEGGGMEFMVHQGRLLQRGRHLEGSIDKLYNLFGYLGETTEVMTRLAIRERVIKNRARERGISVDQARRDKAITQEATFAARDYMDFGQGGSITKAVDNGVPYLNAAVQGSRGLLRSFKDGTAAESTAKLAQLAMVTTGVYLATAYNAPETFKQLKGSEDAKNNLIIPLGDSFGFLDEKGQMRYPYFKIPLDPGQKFFKTFFEGMTDKWLGNEVDVDRITEALKDQAPIDMSQLPPTMSAVFGYMYNKDFWRNEQIFKGSKEAFPWPRSAEEFDEKTPEMYKAFGSATGMSPERTRYAVEQLLTKNSMWKALGGKAYDEVFSDLPKSQKEQHLARILANMPVVKRFIGVTNPYSKYASKIEEAEQKAVIDKFVQTRDFDILVERHLYDETATIDEVFNEASKYDLDTYERLIDRFRWETVIKGMPEQSFWKRLKGIAPEARAEIFVHRLNKSNEQEKEQLWREFSQIAAAGGVITEKFVEEVSKRMSK